MSQVPYRGRQNENGNKTNPKQMWYRSFFSLKRAGISSYKVLVHKTLKRGMSIKLLVQCEPAVERRTRPRSPRRRGILALQEESSQEETTPELVVLFFSITPTRNEQRPKEYREAFSRKWGRGKTTAYSRLRSATPQESTRGGKRQCLTSDGPCSAASWRGRWKGAGWPW